MYFRKDFSGKKNIKKFLLFYLETNEIFWFFLYDSIINEWNIEMIGMNGKKLILNGKTMMKVLNTTNCDISNFSRMNLLVDWGTKLQSPIFPWLWVYYYYNTNWIQTFFFQKWHWHKILSYFQPNWTFNSWVLLFLMYTDPNENHTIRAFLIGSKLQIFC